MRYAGALLVSVPLRLKATRGLTANSILQATDWVQSFTEITELGY